ncbi:amidohydrolase family protein [Kribbella sp.]|uniref:amidohydrolase family protein n=1 Tax=Kribbella sp. TaxID=1871183 RepID=UPI002D3F1E4E|nr:amidohydrolase family protein [Kribbella sp.]HZX07113.1 amidohydrolase family protein [Kribbella sp.]
MTSTLIRGGSVLSLDPVVGDLDQGDVLITDGVIADVAAQLDVPDGAEVIDATGCLVAPGFVDNHRHTWQTAFRGIGADWTFADYAAGLHGTLKPHYRPEDVYLGNLLGRLEALHSGVTTMLDWFHAAQTPDHADAALAGLRDAPGRSIFCYGAGYRTDDLIEAEVRRVHAAMPADDLLTLALGLRGPDETTMDNVALDLKLADELGLGTSVHVDGLDGHRPISALAERGLLRASTTFVHANGVSDDELRMLADAGASVSISPDVELKMGFGQPMTGRVLAAGLRPTLSVDDTPAVGGDMFSTMRTAFAAQRGIDGGLTARELLRFATIDAARSCGLGDRVGTVAPGKNADLVLLRADDLTVTPFSNPAGMIVTSGHPGLVDTVLVAGRTVKRNGHLVGVDLPTLKARLIESRNHLATAAGVPLDGTWRPGTTA